MSKEAMARAANSQNMEMEEGVVHDPDRLAAMAGGDVLGGLLLRFRESAQPQWGHRIVLHLARRARMRHHLALPLATRTAATALEEFSCPHCVACNGAREIMFDQVKITCEDCDGTGMQRFSNHWRRARIGSYGARIDSAMADCHQHMSASLASYMSRATGRMG